MDNLLLLLHMPLVPAARIPESHWLEYQHTLIVVLLNILRSVNFHRRGFDPVEDLIRHLQLRHLVDKRGVSHGVKNAFEKSNAMTLTNGFVDSIVSMVWKRAISAAVVEPVGLKPNWSAK